MTSVAAAAVAAEAGADDPALLALMDMGFAMDRARAALDAAGGDIAGAVDALSHA
jgi:NACalpha-BTF3-like transcription factor